MKRILIGSLLAITSLSALAEAPGGPNCGWGNMLFEGERGLPSHFIASTTNGTSGNATFGMTSGTNGCSTDGALTYGGKSLLAINGMLDEPFIVMNSDLLTNCDFRQVILEFYTPGIPDSGWVHVSYVDPDSNRKSVLTALKENGKTAYKVGLITE